MGRRGSGEVTRKVPARVELRKARIASDARFARLVRTSIVRAIRNGARTFGDLLLDLPSIYPTEVLAAMDRMPRLPGVDAKVLGRIRAEAGAPSEGRAAGGSLLPLPHPLDFEWRFSEDTCRAMLDAASETTREGDTILLYDTPGLAYAAISLPVRNRRVVFADQLGHRQKSRQLPARVCQCDFPLDRHDRRLGGRNGRAPACHPDECRDARGATVRPHRRMQDPTRTPVST